MTARRPEFQLFFGAVDNLLKSGLSAWGVVGYYGANEQNPVVIFQRSGVIATEPAAEEAPEYFALIDGLRALLRELRFIRPEKAVVVVRSNSETVQQLLGNRTADHPSLQTYYAIATALASKFAEVSFVHDPSDESADLYAIATSTIHGPPPPSSFATYSPNLTFALQVRIKENTVYASTDYMCATSDSITMIDGQFLAEALGPDTLHNLDDPSPLHVIHPGQNPILGVLNSITMDVLVQQGVGKAKKLTYTNVLVVVGLPVPVHLACNSSAFVNDVFGEAAQANSLGAKFEASIFPTTYRGHKFWQSVRLTSDLPAGQEGEHQQSKSTPDLTANTHLTAKQTGIENVFRSMDSTIGLDSSDTTSSFWESGTTSPKDNSLHAAPGLTGAAASAQEGQSDVVDTTLDDAADGDGAAGDVSGAEEASVAMKKGGAIKKKKKAKKSKKKNCDRTESPHKPENSPKKSPSPHKPPKKSPSEDASSNRVPEEGGTWRYPMIIPVDPASTPALLEIAQVGSGRFSNDGFHFLIQHVLFINQLTDAFFRPKRNNPVTTTDEPEETEVHTEPKSKPSSPPKPSSPLRNVSIWPNVNASGDPVQALPQSIAGKTGKPRKDDIPPPSPFERHSDGAAEAPPESARVPFDFIQDLIPANRKGGQEKKGKAGKKNGKASGDGGEGEWAEEASFRETKGPKEGSLDEPVLEEVLSP
ncbi:hypothetical protein HDV00_004557 [Rhizophlyctis rosea]|nr:hypothetical protein HDV00_004557 [Rhizophlyctis rosea]